MTIDPDIIASVRLFSVAEGGRSIATPGDFLGCIFDIAGDLYECRLLLTQTGSVSPGAQATLPIKFLSPELLRGKLTAGQPFHLREGGNRIGKGIVEKLLM
ncbi:MAG: hypothetical protein AB1586_21290 [Pseudomonadota bacterium]